MLSYSAIAVAFSWPLPLRLGTFLTGPHDGDTGLYVWNQWVFRHELVAHKRLPYFTDSIFSIGPDTNLGLHNYTEFQNLLALPLAPLVGTVATFNLVFLAMSVLTAYATFLLARRVTGRSAEAWLAGLVFAWSPLLVTRGMGHFSLVAAAPLAIFLLVLVRAHGHERPRDALALGAVLAWAATTDVYYAVYCLLLGALFLAHRLLVVSRRPQPHHAALVSRTLDGLLLSVGGLVAAIALSGGGAVTLAGLTLSMRGLYTPVLVLTVLVVIRAVWQLRVSLRPTASADAWPLARLTAYTGLTTAVLLSPVLYAVGVKLAEGQVALPQVFWRTSPPGVDLLALVAPNPNHPLAPAATTDWLHGLPAGYLESVVSIPLIVALTMLLAWRTGWRAPGSWVALALTFGALALGPFVHVAGWNTFVPGPWALLRYVPIFGLARTPARFSVVMMLAVAVLFAMALTWIGRRYPAHRRLAVGAAALLLLAELLPAPLTLHPATVPAFYQQVAAAGEGRLLELPTGARSGTSNVGDFSARSQFYQTAHGKPLVGGYLSRVSESEVAEWRRTDMVDALVLLSEGASLPPEREAALIDAGPAFVHDASLGFVVIDHARASKRLTDFAQRALRLERVDGAGSLALYRPGS